MMFGMALGMASPLPCGDHPNIWQDDGYGGKIWTVNPDCYKNNATNSTPTKAEGFPLIQPLWGSPSASDSNDTMTEYEAYDEEYVDDAGNVQEEADFEDDDEGHEDETKDSTPAYDELGTFAGSLFGNN